VAAVRRAGKRSKGPRRGAAALGDLLARVYPSSEPEELRLVRAIAWWDKHVPPRIARNARPARMRRGALVIHAVTGAWAQELTMLLPTFLPPLERAVRGIDGRRTRVQVGPLPPRPAPPKPAAAPLPAMAVGDLPENVARGLAAIPDDRVRDAVARAAAQSLAPRRTGRGRAR
jgi:hypothetical protein